MLWAGPRSGPPAWRNRTPKSREGRGRSAAPESGPKGSPVWGTDGSKERWGAEGSSPAAEAWGGAGRHSCTSFSLDQTQPSSKKHLPPRAPGTSSQTPGSSVHISYLIKKPLPSTVRGDLRSSRLCSIKTATANAFSHHLILLPYIPASGNLSS